MRTLRRTFLMVAFTIVAGIVWFLHPLSANAQEVTTIAGDGTRDFLDGTGTAAKFKYPYGVAVQGDSLFVADRTIVSARSS